MQSQQRAPLTRHMNTYRGILLQFNNFFIWTKCLWLVWSYMFQLRFDYGTIICCMSSQDAVASSLRSPGETGMRGRRSCFMKPCEMPGCDGDARKTQLLHEALGSIVISSEARDLDARSSSEVSTGRRGDREKRRAKRETGERDIAINIPARRSFLCPPLVGGLCF